MPSCCALLPRFALLPPPLMLPPQPHHYQAAANVTLLGCSHRRSICPAATALPPSCCAPLQCFALPPPPLTLLPLPRRCQAAANISSPLLIVIFPSILTPSPHLTPPLFCQYTPRSPHIVCVTQIRIKHCVGWFVVLTNPMDCTQTKRTRHRPWCVDDAYALGWGALMPHATVWAKAAQHQGCGDTINKKYLQDGFRHLV
jgi:hypothetical protein